MDYNVASQLLEVGMQPDLDVLWIELSGNSGRVRQGRYLVGGPEVPGSEGWTASYAVDHYAVFVGAFPVAGPIEVAVFAVFGALEN